MNEKEKALFGAIEGEKVTEVERLIKDGVDVNAKDNNGWAPLHCAAWLKKTKIARLLLEKDADVNAETDRGSTPLHWAAWRENEKTARLIIENGAEVNAKNEDGWTPLDMTETQEMRALLKEHGGMEG